MMNYTVTELAGLLREYSHGGLSVAESLALAEHLDYRAQAFETVPAVLPAHVAEWRSYQTLAAAADAVGVKLPEGLTGGRLEDAARDHFVASSRWDVVEVGGGSSYLMRDGGC